jgi:hypothetical protein
VYPKISDLLNSTEAARLNAFAAGNLSVDKLRAELVRSGLLEPAQDSILEIAEGSAKKAVH